MKKSKNLSPTVLVLVILICMNTSLAFSKTKVTKLICEYHVNPIGIDVEQPRLSWQIVSDKGNVKQSVIVVKEIGGFNASFIRMLEANP